MIRHLHLHLRALFFLGLGLFTSCSSEQEDAERAGVAERNARPRILTTFYPLQFFAERLTGNWARVDCPLPEDADPIFWMPDDAAIQAYQSADLVFINGAQFEQWVDKVSLPSGIVVDTASVFSDRFLTYEDAIVHQHGPEGEHAHEGIDGHTWVAPELAELQIAAMADALTERWPARSEEVSQARKALVDELNSLGEGFSDAAAALGSRSVLASHPAYQYWARQYDVSMINLDLDPDAEPSAEAWQTVAEEAESSGASILLWESEPTAAWVTKTKDAGITSIVFSPCESAPPAGEDYFSVMQGNLERLREAIDAIAPADAPESSPAER